jgi:phage/plasmid-associated DNA primase
LVKRLPFPIAIIKKFFKNEDGSTGELYFITNNLENDVDRIYEIYQKWCKIEGYYKSIKQNTSFEKSLIKAMRSQKNHIFSSILQKLLIKFF